MGFGCKVNKNNLMVQTFLLILAILDYFKAKPY